MLNAASPSRDLGPAALNAGQAGADHHSFAEHETIITAIENRDMSGAAAAMRAHLQSVERNLLARQSSEAD